MSDKLIWSSNMTRDYILGLGDEEKKNMLIDRGYDEEQLDGADLDQMINSDEYMWEDDSDDFSNNVVPMISRQTYQGKIILLNADDKQADVVVCTPEELNSGDICPEASDMAIHDTGEGIEVSYYDKDGQNILTLIPYAIPEDKAEQEEFIKNVMPGFDDDDIVDYDSFSDDDELEDFVNKDQLKVHGKRIRNEMNEEFDGIKFDFPEEEKVEFPEFDNVAFEEGLDSGSKLYKDLIGEELSRNDAEELEPEIDQVYDDLFTIAREADASNATETSDTLQKAMDVIDDKSEVINEEQVKESNMDKLKAHYGPMFEESLTEAEKDYLVVPGDMAIAKDLMKDESLDEEMLDEALPKDLAKAYKTHYDVRREHDYGALGAEGNYKGIKAKDPMVDFQNSTYEKITPEEAIALYKAGQSRNVHVVIDGKLANVYLATDPATGKVKAMYDFKALGDFKKDSGKDVPNSAYLTPKELYNNADAIYKVTEVAPDLALRAERAKNPESSRNFRNMRRMLPTDKTIPSDVQRRINRGIIQIDPATKTARYNSEYTAYVTDTNGNPMDRNKFYGVEDMERLYKGFADRWSQTDVDVQSVKYIVDQLKGGTNKQGSPLNYDWSLYDMRKNALASARYKDAENALQTTMRAGKETVKEIKNYKDRLERQNRERTNLSDPTNLAQEKAYIQRRINDARDSINYYMKNLLKYQDQLEDVDINNQKAIDEVDAKIADTMSKIDELRQQMKKLFKK